MSLLRSLFEKPWERSLHAEPGETFGVPPQKVALAFFLGVASVLFALFITAYFIRMELDDWRPLPEPAQLWLNTGILFLASVALQWTSSMTVRGELGRVRLGILVGGALSFAFVLAQVDVWGELRAAGFYLSSNPANAFFFLLTGVHALHVLGGLWVWTRAGIRSFSGAGTQDLQLSVELCALYWHFLLLVWLVLFALLSYT